MQTAAFGTIERIPHQSPPSMVKLQQKAANRRKMRARAARGPRKKTAKIDEKTKAALADTIGDKLGLSSLERLDGMLSKSVKVKAAEEKELGNRKERRSAIVSKTRRRGQSKGLL